MSLLAQLESYMGPPMMEVVRIPELYGVRIEGEWLPGENQHGHTRRWMKWLQGVEGGG